MSIGANATLNPCFYHRSRGQPVSPPRRAAGWQRYAVGDPSSYQSAGQRWPPPRRLTVARRDNARDRSRGANGINSARARRRWTTRAAASMKKRPSTTSACFTLTRRCSARVLLRDVDWGSSARVRCSSRATAVDPTPGPTARDDPRDREPRSQRRMTSEVQTTRAERS